ncbi:amidohydrolase [Flavilitoribacter nigricans]|uniref:Amidohydrolase n=1 Tax=Flavilitoribacter nigricans (strain ATCC 23147 / DSM 23189 / NBRC 102662 / NCIMB 1420 / SS-2) TaxID=1122177 RepID=A0A2D0MY64_FLAN2|nr:amidohydrolase [Flavilitoribacter nigricans]PHN01185.1 amidohydrolase [Flavilitoribacter nigricans DSM 23189 = NBRC 102662]
MRWILYSFFFLVLLSACQSDSESTEKADLILYNAQIYTVSEAMPTAEAVAVKDGNILLVGDSASVFASRQETTELIDLQGQFMMPGFIEGHGHFSGLGGSLMNLNFLRSKSWDEIVAMVAEKVKTAEPGEWITGRGWHQEKWIVPIDEHVHGYPYHDKLSEISPDNPVLLRHASGHSLFANAKAMEIAGVSIETPNPSGGEIVRDSRGNAIGVFEERAMNIIGQAYQEYLSGLSEEQRKSQWLKGIELAQEECLKKGITSFQDAGSRFYEIDSYKELADAGELDLRLWVMLRHPYEEMKDNMEGLPVIDYGNGYFTCRAVKSEVDGALGAFGAWLLSSYDDKADFVGQNTTQLETVSNIADLCLEHDMQLCVHAIGDRANREVLNIFAEKFSELPEKQDLRWRIEHAQHLDPEDIPRFSELGVIAAMQGIHCTSDAPFVVKRLGEKRAREGAYPWRSLLDAGAVVGNGTDAPVEDVDPIESFYATVTRKRADTGMEFFPEQAMTRAEAIRSYTWSNAYAAFEEEKKGSIEAGKYADLVVLSKNLMDCPDEEIMDTQILLTIVDGKIKYDGRNN